MIWYVGLASPRLHIERVISRVASGGHPIPDEMIRQRWDASRLNLIRLLPRLDELMIYDNSRAADPKLGQPPGPWLVLHQRQLEIVAPSDLSATPDWANRSSRRRSECASPNSMVARLR